MKYSKIFLIALISAFTSCKKEDQPKENPSDLVKEILEIKVVPYFSSSLLDLDSVYTTNTNFKVQFFDLKCYFSNLKNGTNQLASIGFFDFPVTGTQFLTVENDYTKFSNLSFNVGVDSTDNHADPSAFPLSNPLNIMIAGEMHWDWNPGYIFIKIDGKADTIPDGITNMNHFFSYHVGKDENRIPLSFSQISWKSSGENKKIATIKIDMAQFFQGPNNLDVRSESKTHSEAGKEALSLKIIQNFASSLSFIP
jgi:hypothetical protein